MEAVYGAYACGVASAEGFANAWRRLEAAAASPERFGRGSRSRGDGSDLRRFALVAERLHRGAADAANFSAAAAAFLSETTGVPPPTNAVGGCG